MVTFIRLVKIIDLSYTFIYEDSFTLEEIKNTHINNENTKFILTLEDPENNLFHIDLSKLLINEKIDSSIITILDFIENFITPEMIYSYHDPKYAFDNTAKFIQEADIPNELLVQAYSIIRNESSTIYDDPHYPDLSISSNSISLERMFPVFDGKLKDCIWNNQKILMKDSSDIVFTHDIDGFLSFQNSADVQTQKIKDIIDNNEILLDIPNSEYAYSVVVVLGGHLFYNDDSVYKYFSEYRKLHFNSSFIMNKSMFSNYVDFNELINDNDSFVILVACNDVLKRTLKLSKDSLKLSNQYFKQDRESFLNFFCVNTKTGLIKKFVKLDEKYIKVVPDIHGNTGPNRNEIHLDNRNNISDDHNLIQLSLI